MTIFKINNQKLEPISEIKEFITSLKWTFAKTMPEIPHEYIVTDNYPEKSKEISNLIEEINQNDYTKKFYAKEYQYLKINGYKYWVIENIINREKIEDKK